MTSKLRSLLFAATVALGSAAQAQIAIDQSRALAGGITAGDSPGFPITLTQPGSYKLTGPLTVPAGTSGIVVTVPGVLLDLNGYTISGPQTCGSAFCIPLPDANGIEAQAGQLLMRNGTVRNFAGSGVVFAGTATLEDLVIRNNSSAGVLRAPARAAGFSDEGHALLRNVQVVLNGSHGINAYEAELYNCTATRNAGDGFRIDSGMVIDSAANANKGYGMSSGMGAAITRSSRYDGNGIKSVGGFVLSSKDNLFEGQIY